MTTMRTYAESMDSLPRLGRLTRAPLLVAVFFSAWFSLAVVQGVQAQVQDTTPPSCAITAVITGPPKQFQITVQDIGSGLRTIEVTTATNASVSVPAFAVGTTSPVVVTATKIDQSQSFTVGLRATDVAGNVTTCEFDDVPEGGGGGGNPGATPELDSLALFGSGLVGLGGYALMRLRARRQRAPVR